MKRYRLARLNAKLASLKDRRSSLVPFSTPYCALTKLITKTEVKIDDVTNNRFYRMIILWLAVIAALIIMASILSSCSNSKKVANQVEGISKLEQKLDDKKDQILAKGVADYVKQNPCECPDINIDSILNYYRYGAVIRSSIISHHDSIANLADLKNDLPHIIIRSIPDSRLTNLLNDSVTELHRRLSECQGNIAGRKDAAKEVATQLEPGHWAINYWTWIAIGLTLIYFLKVVITRKP